MIKAFLEVFKLKKNKPALILKVSQGAPSIMDRDVILKKIVKCKPAYNEWTQQLKDSCWMGGESMSIGDPVTATTYGWNGTY